MTPRAVYWLPERGCLYMVPDDPVRAVLVLRRFPRAIAITNAHEVLTPRELEVLALETLYEAPPRS